jgi:hypothetical protein
MQELSLLATEEVGFFHKQEHFDFGWYVELDLFGAKPRNMSSRIQIPS